jgi:hypothetical protein
VAVYYCVQEVDVCGVGSCKRAKEPEQRQKLAARRCFCCDPSELSSAVVEVHQIVVMEHAVVRSALAQHGTTQAPHIKSKHAVSERRQSRAQAPTYLAARSGAE